MKKLFILLFICLSIRGYGQTAAQYVLARSTGAPTTIVGGGGTVATTGLSDDDLTQTGIPIGFNFVYCGTTRTTLSACSNGWISLANSTSTEYLNATTWIPSAAFLMPFWDDLDGYTYTAYYQTSGSAPNRVFTMQWGQPSPAAQRWGNLTGSGRASWQVRLYESSNIVEFAYLFSNYSGNTATVGISNSASDYKTLPTTASTTASSSTFTTSLTTIPAANSILDWTPPPTMSVSPSSLTFTTAPSTTTAAQLVTLVAYGLTGNVTVSAPSNFQVFNPGTSTWGTTATITNSTAALGTYINTTVQVRFVGPAATGTYTGNLTFTSTGATTRTVALTGNVIATCGGTPTPGTASATVTSGSCNPYTSTLSTTGTTSSFGIGYQWQSSPDNITYTDVSGATNTTYAPTISGNIYYRARITCSYSGLSANTAGVLFSYTAPPAAITGASAVCVASTISLSSATGGGTWGSSNTSIATVNSSGVVTGAAIGTANITYTASGCPVTKTITVNGAPSVITFTPSSSTVCLGNGTAFTAATTGPSATILSQDFNSGLGSWSITNTSGNATSYFQIWSPPGYSGDITGDGTPYIEAAPDAISTNTTTSFASPVFSTVGYTAATLTYNQFFESWSSGDVAVGVQYSTNGGTSWTNLVNQLGTNDLSYSWSAATPQKTVALPAAAIGQANVKLRWVYNSTWGFWWAVDNIKVTGTSAVTYAWTGPSGLSCTTCNNPTITPTATGANVYTLTATATSNSCTRLGNVTVTANPLPAAIGGTAVVCSGLTTTLTNATGSGTWTSSNSGVASINSSTGVVTGGTAGTATITYTITSTGCYITKVVTVNALPANITGTPSACVAASTTLADATTPGTWSSGTTGIATVGSSTGIVNGVSAGLSVVTYTLSTGCIKTVEVTINPLPATTISPATSATICMGESTSFTANAPAPAFNILLQDFNSGLGAWTITNTSGTAASYWQITSSATSGATGDGTAMLEASSDAAYTASNLQLTTILTSPSFSTVGYGSATVTFNEYLISLTSDANVDVDYSINGGTTWTTLLSQVGVGSSLSGGGSGSWSSSGTPEVSISLPAAALGVSNVKLRWHYNAYAGLYWDIDNIKVTAYQPAATYVWTGVSGASGLSCTACGTTTITPTATGTNVYSVTSSTSAGCQSTTGVTVTVNPMPADVTGTFVICENSTTTLTDATSGGTWSSASSLVSVDASSGAVTGITAGTAVVTYMLPAGCTKTAVVTVNAQPAAITGVMQVCEGLTTTLSSTPGGDWTSAVPATATIGSSTGVVNGVAMGTTDITYTFPLTGCFVSANVTVNHTPAAIGGVSVLCENGTTTLTNADGGGTWASSAPSIAAIGSADGALSALAAGTTTITYQLPAGCISTKDFTVNALPAAITGVMQVCEGLTTTLSSTPGGDWTSAVPATATIGSSTGVVNGVAMGTTDITYTFPLTGCFVSANVTVNHTPAAIAGVFELCENGTTTLTNADGSGIWTSSVPSVASIGSADGVLSALTAGATIITYQLPAGCISTKSFTVNALPGAITGVMQVCEGLTTTLSSTTLGGDWTVAVPATATIGISTGIVTGGSTGTTDVTYTLPATGCLVTANVTVNHTPAAIGGVSELCENGTTTLTNADGGGVWTSSVPSVASIGSADGVLSALVAGSTIITYQLPAGCISTKSFTVNALPGAITGIMQVCEGLTTTLSSTTLGGDWTVAVPATATIGISTGIVTGGSTGTTDVTYTLPATGCLVTANVTVNHTPAAIGGVSELCENSTTTLTNADGGGVWTSSVPSVASVGSADGVLSALTAGSTIITYQLPAGCSSTKSFTVNALPSAITGVMQVCEGLTTTLSSTTLGGDWTVAVPATATIGISTGVVTGGSTGTTDVTYTLPATGCLVTANVTVNHTPAAITGMMEVCEGLQTTLSNIDAGGTWSGSAPGVATIDINTGIVSAIAAGNTNIVYQLPAGCTSSAVVTVNPLPAVITGYTQVCEGLTTPLSDATTGGAWSSNGVYTSVDAGGVVTGITAGVETITYQLPTTCLRTADVSVNPTPAAITGAMTVCEGLTTTLNDADAGGTWTSGATATATIDPSTGIVNGIAAGVATITYELPTTCINTADVTVNPLPATIVGASQVCVGLTITMTDAAAGGNWSSSAPGVAVIDAGGVLLGMSAGVTTVTYTLPTSCIITKTVTVNPLPAAINGILQVCEGLTTALTNATPGGAWSSGTPAVATISTSGLVSAAVAGNTIITYMLPTTCISTANVTVNPLPAAIGGLRIVCEGSTTTLNDADAGGTWTSSIGSVAGIDAAGVVSGISAGTTAITYTLPTGCITTSDLTVNPLPAAIAGISQVCEGLTTTLTNATGTGTWSSGATSIADINISTGVVSAYLAGTAPITYMLPTGCFTTKQVTVNPLPSPIGGIPQVCLGATTTLTNLAPGGTWSSSDPGVASINITSGVVYGLTIGSAGITYTLPTGCLMRTSFVVNALPAPITGPSQICESAISAYADGSAGGTWSSSTPLVATVNNITGAVTGNASGITLITYTLTTGCIRTRPLTVNPLPNPITGIPQVCQSATTTLANSTPGGTWTSTEPTVATVNSFGAVSGVNAGTSIVAYKLSTGCIAYTTVTVDPTPSILTPGAVMCQGQTVTLPTSIAGGSWSSGAPSTATVDAGGVVTAVGAGLAYISYTMPTGCGRSIPVSVNPTPSAITGAATVCQGSTTTMSGTSSGAVWTSAVTSVASINLTTGVVTGLAAGTTTISYTNPVGGCFMTHIVTVNEAPAAFTGTPVVCSGQTTAFSSTPAGGTWTSGAATIATVGTSGSVSGVSAGTAIITYSLASGCLRSRMVTVNALPAVYNVTGGGAYCSGGSGVHIGLDNSNGGANYQLYSGATPVGAAITGVTGLPLDFGLVATSGTYSVVATSAATGCSSNMTGSTTVSVSSLVPASVSVITGSGSDTVCSGMPITFTATATNGGTTPVYEWRVNGIVMTGAAANTYTYTPANGDVITVNMGSSVACATPSIATAARTITVNTSVMPVAGISVTPGTTICQGGTATFTASALYGGTSPVFAWMKNGSMQTTGPTYSYTPANGDVVYVQLVSNFRCRLADMVNSSSITMNVNPSYNPVVNITANPGNVVQIGTSVTLTANVTNAGPSPEYQWYIGSSPIGGATNATFTNNTFANGDSVSCIVTGTGSCGIAGYNSVIMHVGGVGVPVVGGDADIRLMPNPNKGEFVVRGTLPAATDKEVAIEVTNMLGQVVYKTSLIARNGNVDAQVRLDNTLANGMYMLNIISGGDRKVFHFVLEQ